MKNNDYYDYLSTFANPLDNKYRWEVNQALKARKITEKQSKTLLQVSPQAFGEIARCVRNNIYLNPKVIGRFYIKSATAYAKRKQKKQESKIPIFSH